MTNKLMSGVVAWLALSAAVAQAQVGQSSSHITSSTVTTVVNGTFLPASLKLSNGSDRPGKVIGYRVNPSTAVTVPGLRALRGSDLNKPFASGYSTVASILQGNQTAAALATTGLVGAGVPAVTATSLVSLVAMVRSPTTVGQVANAAVLFNAAMRTLNKTQIRALINSGEGKAIHMLLKVALSSMSTQVNRHPTNSIRAR